MKSTRSETKPSHTLITLSFFQSPVVMLRLNGSQQRTWLTVQHSGVAEEPNLNPNKQNSCRVNGASIKRVLRLTPRLVYI